MVCTECGMTNAEHIAIYTRSLDVHRTTPGSRYTIEAGVCVTLCRVCHSSKPKSSRKNGGPRDNCLIQVKPVLFDACQTEIERLCQSMPEYVNDAVRMRLEAEGAWPPPPPRKPA